MPGHSFPVSLGLPRWRPCQLPDPGVTLKCQNPYPGEGTLSQFPLGSHPPPPPPTLGLNIDRCINLTDLWITSLLFVLNYKFINGASLLALAKSIYYFYLTDTNMFSFLYVPLGFIPSALYFRIGQYKTWTADHGLRTGYKTRTRYKRRTTNYVYKTSFRKVKLRETESGLA